MNLAALWVGVRDITRGPARTAVTLLRFGLVSEIITRKRERGAAVNLAALWVGVRDNNPSASEEPPWNLAGALGWCPR